MTTVPFPDSEFWRHCAAIFSTAPGNNGLLRDVLQVKPGTLTKAEEQGGFERVYQQTTFQVVAPPGASEQEIRLTLAAHYFVCRLVYQYRFQALFSRIRVIGNNGLLHELSMADYYTDLSSLDRSKVSSDTDLFVIEKEGHSIKKKKRVRGEIFTNYLSTGVVSEALIANFEQSVVIGNPGVGKSTYARWLCHQWAAGQLTSPFVLVYVNLRELDYGRQRPLLEYLAGQYAPAYGGRNAAIEPMLMRYTADLKFILDGLDEIDQPDKAVLEQELRALHPGGEFPPYLLLSRPYGIRNTSFRQIRYFHEILGFNEGQRRHYIGRMLSQPVGHSALSAADLLEKIETNPVLQDISFNPLMLSYLVLIYLEAGPKGENRLFERIESAYQLQDRILSLLIDYHGRDKGMDERQYAVSLEGCRAISGELELNKQFVYAGRSVRDRHYPAALLLSQLGVGRYEDRQPAGNWQFYFNSITFQEFLAAEHFGARMTPYTFVYLLGDLFFWNFSKMLLGYFSYYRLDNVLNGIFQLLQQRFDANKLAYYEKLKFIILSELDPPIIRQRMTKLEIAHMIEFAFYAWNDYLRRDLYSDAVYKIYRKMTPEQQAYLLDFIPYYLSYTIDLESGEEHRVRFPESLLQIIRNLGLVDEPAIASCLLEYLIGYQEKSAAVWNQVDEQVNKQGKEYDFEGGAENWLLELYDTSLIGLYETLKTAGRATLQALKPRIEYLCDTFPDSLQDQSIDLLMSLAEPDAYYRECSAMYAQARRVFEENQAGPEREVYPDPGMVALSRLCIGLARGVAEKPAHEKTAAAALLVNIEALFEAYTGSDFAEPEEVETIFTHFTEALKRIGEPSLYPMLFRHLAAFRIPELFDISDPEGYTQYIESALAALPDSRDITTDFRTILHALESTTFGRLTLYRYRERLAVQLLSIVRPEARHLEKLIARKTPERYVETEDEPVPALLAQVQRAFHYPYDRKFLLEFYRDHGLLENSYFARHHVPELLSEEFAFSEPWIWAYIRGALLGPKPVYLKLFAILYNEMIYALPDNLASLLAIWEDVFQREEDKAWKTFFNKQDSYVFIALYRLLRHFFTTSGQTSAQYRFLQALDSRLPHWHSAFYSESNLHHLDMCPETMGLYALHGWIQQDVRWKPDASFHPLLLRRPDIYRKIALDWIDLAGDRWADLPGYFPAETIAWFQQQYDLQQEINYRLEPEKFWGLLRAE